MKRILLTSLTICLLTTLTFSQNTVGLLSYDPANAFDGYNLYFPHNQGTIYLLDNCGEIVHQWDDPTFKPGNGFHLAENGNLYVCKGRGAASNPDIHAGGGGEKVEIRDWDNNLIWEYTVNDSLQRLHHDLTVLPDGNVLLIAWEKKTATEAIAAGRDPNRLIDGEIWAEKIIEVQPVGQDSGMIVWEWHTWDHLVQDFDSTKANYGVIANNPRLIDINHTPSGGVADWQHANGIDFNEAYNQILLSVPTFNEIWIIDHSTTTATAMGHVGGFSGLGGDLMFRWGNPQAYGQGTVADQQLFFQHDPHWLDIGLTSTHPDYQKIGLFNNRVGADYSSVNVLDVFFDCYNWEYPIMNGTFQPANFDWTYTAPTPQDMYSSGLSSMQRLPNGNTLIDVGRFGYFFELDATNNVVWSFKNPMMSGSPVSQGDTLQINQNLVFKLRRYPTSYPAFTGRDLSQKGWIEQNPDTALCDLILTTKPIDWSSKVLVFPNPSTDYFQVFFDSDYNEIERIAVFDMIGRKVYEANNITNMTHHKITVNNWDSGIYLLTINGQYASKLVVTK